MFLRVSNFIFVLTVLTILNKLSGQGVQSGVFCHPPSGECIQIQVSDRGLMVKRSFQQSWRLFSRDGKHVYFDRKANRIEVISPVELVFVNHHSVKGLHYILQKALDQYMKNYAVTTEPQKVVNYNRIEGLWYSEEYQEYLIVVETREGIKVRQKDARIWYPYYCKDTREHFFDQHGNQYIFRGQELQYFHHDGYHSIVFRKISDNFDGY